MLTALAAREDLGGGHPGTPSQGGKEAAKKPEKEQPAGQEQLVRPLLLTSCVAGTGAMPLA